MRLFSVLERRQALLGVARQLRVEHAGLGTLVGLTGRREILLSLERDPEPQPPAALLWAQAKRLAIGLDGVGLAAGALIERGEQRQILRLIRALGADLLQHRHGILFGALIHVQPRQQLRERHMLRHLHQTLFENFSGLG